MFSNGLMTLQKKDEEKTLKSFSDSLELRIKEELKKSESQHEKESSNYVKNA